jgi:hypothetical protein
VLVNECLFSSLPARRTGGHAFLSSFDSFLTHFGIDNGLAAQAFGVFPVNGALFACEDFE